MDVVSCVASPHVTPAIETIDDNVSEDAVSSDRYCNPAVSSLTQEIWILPPVSLGTIQSANVEIPAGEFEAFVATTTPAPQDVPPFVVFQ
jgi:hypothetical protein